MRKSETSSTIISEGPGKAKLSVAGETIDVGRTERTASTQTFQLIKAQREMLISKINMGREPFLFYITLPLCLRGENLKTQEIKETELN